MLIRDVFRPHVPHECECWHVLKDHANGMRCLMPDCPCERYDPRVAFPEYQPAPVQAPMRAPVRAQPSRIQMRGAEAPQ